MSYSASFYILISYIESETSTFTFVFVIIYCYIDEFLNVICKLNDGSDR